MLAWMVTSASPSEPSEHDRHQLIRVLGLFSVVAIVVGEVIGSGIFYMPSQEIGKAHV